MKDEKDYCIECEGYIASEIRGLLPPSIPSCNKSLDIITKEPTPCVLVRDGNNLCELYVVKRDG